MDIIRVYKSNKNMTETERKAHIRHLANERQKKLYRKRKLEQLKIKQQQAPKITTQKVNLDEDTDSDEEDTKTLLELYEYITEEPNDKEILEAIDILEDKLGIDEEDKLNVYEDFDSSDYDSD
jgi:hypothetical protein